MDESTNLAVDDDNIDEQTADLTEEPELPADCTFPDITDDQEILKALDGLGFKTPTEVQRRTVPAALRGQDLIVQAQTGSGKTLAFAIPLLQALKASGRERGSSTFALVVVPTRELAVQVSDVVRTITSEVKAVCVIGGADMQQQIREIKEDGRVVVGTPGRLLDLIKQRVLKLNECRFFALDEVDEMLSIGFIEDVRSILSRMPDRRQGLFVSATITPRVDMLANSFLDKPKSILIEKTGGGPAPIEHLYCEIAGDLMAKPSALCDIIETMRPRSAIIFCNTKSDTMLVEALLRRRGFDARRINSDLTQAQRERVMRKIKKGDLQFLVATDIAARGIDIEQIDLVINYAIHEQPETYVHRTGRTGRAGRRGKAISLIGPRDFGAFHFLTKVVDLKFTKIPIPTDTEVADARITHLYEMVRQMEIEIKDRDVLVARQLLREMGGFTEVPEEIETIVAKLSRYAMEHFVSSDAKSLEEELEQKQEALEEEDRLEERRTRDRERRDRGRGDRDDRRGRGDDDRRGRERRPRRDDDRPQEQHVSSQGEAPREERRGDDRERRERGPMEVRVYIGQGEAEGITAEVFKELAAQFAELKAEDLRAISLRDHYGFVDLYEREANALIQNMNGIEYNGAPLPVELAIVPSSRDRGPRRDRGRGGEGRGGRDDRGGRDRRGGGGGRDRRQSRDHQR
jgi:ATP-dependent RNA helicase DeaD